jgi:hypothetical protein
MKRFFEENKPNTYNWDSAGVSDGLTLPCAICGKENIKIDYVVKDEIWDKIVPKEIKRDVVCIECFVKLLNDNNILLGSCIESLQYVNENETVEFIPYNVFVRSYEEETKE